MTTSTTANTQEPAEQTYDAIIIGAGQAGGPLATALGAAGKRTAIIEREHVGGTCINEGCSPTKTMVASARDAYLVRRSADYGVHPGASGATGSDTSPTPLTVDMVKVRQRKRDIVESFRSGSERSLRESANVDLLMGEARFTAPHTLDVRLNDGGETRRLTAPIVVVNTGERPSVPPIPGLADIPYLTSTTIMELDVVPNHLVVLGGGYIALEFGQMFRRFGAQVTVIQRGSRLLSREDADVADAVANILREDGIEVLLDTAITRVERGADGGVDVTARVHDSERTITGSHLLAALGRTPNTDHLDPSAAGIATDQRGYIRVNERLETNVAGVYAVGDVKGGPAFTHISYDDFRILRANLVEGKHATTSGRLVPYTVFIDPQLGGVGVREQEARAQGLDIKVAKMPMSYVARALEVDETRGFMKAIVDAQSEQILGFSVLGIEGGEIMSAVEIAMMGKLPYTTLRDAIFSHPTLMESLNNLFGSFEGE
ncbi:MAG: mercuric reductase [Ktedonobacterales bacterium]